MEFAKYYDIGLNLFCKQFSEPEKIIKEAKENEICCILTGTDIKEDKKINEFVKTHDAYGTAGIHPHNADRAKQADFHFIEQILTQNDKLVAVGECGLDYDRMFSTKENQIRCLEKQIVLAEKLNKPLFLHERSATDDFIKRFKNHLDICKKSVIHCFTGNKATLDRYLSMGFSIGITGWICDDRRAKELRDSFYTPFCVGRDLSQYFSGVFKSKASCKEASCLCRRLRASVLFFVVSDHIGLGAGDYAAGTISRE